MPLSREELAHGLRAVLEHAGQERQHLDFVGLVGTTLWATDGYTVGIYSLPSFNGFDFEMFLPSKEARDMLRFVRPDRVRDRMMRVELLVAEGEDIDSEELHVGLYSEDVNGDLLTSEVYSLYPPEYPAFSFDQLWSTIRDIRKETFYTDEFVLRPSLAARFKAAERQFGDRMRWNPAAPAHERAGQRAIVRVGSNFLGAVIGLGEPADNNDIPFGDSTLTEWGL